MFSHIRGDERVTELSEVLLQVSASAPDHVAHVLSCRCHHEVPALFAQPPATTENQPVDSALEDQSKFMARISARKATHLCDAHIGSDAYSNSL